MSSFLVNKPQFDTTKLKVGDGYSLYVKSYRDNSKLRRGEKHFVILRYVSPLEIQVSFAIPDIDASNSEMRTETISIEDVSKGYIEITEVAPITRTCSLPSPVEITLS